MKERAMPVIELAAGPVEYDDRGSGPPIVFLHGAHLNATLWTQVVDELAATYRCVVPTLPMGGHRKTVHADADLSLTGIASMVADVLVALDLDDVTLVGNDTGGALCQVLVTTRPDRVGRLVLASCEAFDNFPPGLPGRVSKLSGQLPGGLWQAAQAMRFGPLTRLPLTFGRLAKRPIPADVRDSWFGPLRESRAIRQETRRFLRGLDAAELTTATGRLSGFDRPALVVWAREDQIMPPKHAERLAELLPGSGDVVWIDDSYALIPLDQPIALAQAIDDFVGG
jgi:pimeloyl-ACP methyl ester carboxylesterase